MTFDQLSLELINHTTSFCEGIAPSNPSPPQFSKNKKQGNEEKPKKENRPPSSAKTYPVALYQLETLGMSEDPEDLLDEIGADNPPPMVKCGRCFKLIQVGVGCHKKNCKFRTINQ